MNNQENPYGGFGAQQIRYGSQADPAPHSGVRGQAPFVKDTTTATFSADVVQESRNQPVLVDFWAPWCGPCKQLTPILEKAVNEAAGAVRLVKMNIDEHPGIAGQLGIQSIPAVIAFKDGRPVDGFMGAIPESQIKEFIQRIGGVADGSNDGLGNLMAAAAESVTGGDWATAAQLYTAVLQEAPGNVDAAVGLVEALYWAGDLNQAKQVLASLPAEAGKDARIGGLRAKIALAEQTASLGDAAELTRRLQADPQDHQARFDLALIQNERGQRTDAAENLLAIVRCDRSWKDDGARSQLLQFFDAWGMADEATLAARRRLSSLLFS